MNCANCNHEFNLQNRKPVKLPCNHIFCFKCVYKLKKQDECICPLDETKLDKF